MGAGHISAAWADEHEVYRYRVDYHLNARGDPARDGDLICEVGARLFQDEMRARMFAAVSGGEVREGEWTKASLQL